MNIYGRYVILPGKESETLQRLLTEYQPNRLFIRKSSGNREHLVDEDISGRSLSVEDYGTSWIFKTDGIKVFEYEFQGPTGRRIELNLTPNSRKMLQASYALEPCISGANYDHFFEIYFTRQDIEMERVTENFWVMK